MTDITRYFVEELRSRLRQEAPLPQVVLGARQVGKTTGVKQLLASYEGKWRYVTADDILVASGEWLREQWQEARLLGQGALLVIDEIQKVPNWSETFKALWDSSARPPLRCVLLGSSSLSIQQGLTESLAGRFELVHVPHWSFEESARAFGHDLRTYLIYGGYPGAERFRADYDRWFRYLKTSVVDMVIGQDILSHRTVTKPALFRQAFEILCGYPACEVSYSTLLGQLQDHGNTDLIKHYLELYEGAFLFASVFKLSSKAVRIKSSSPKVLPACPALMTLVHGPDAIDNPEHRGRVFEAVVGMDLHRSFGEQIQYWREGKREVDFVVKSRGRLFGVEVKSGRRRPTDGLAAFRTTFSGAKCLFVTPENYPDFARDPRAFVEALAT